MWRRYSYLGIKNIDGKVPPTTPNEFSDCDQLVNCSLQKFSKRIFSVISIKQINKSNTTQPNKSNPTQYNPTQYNPTQYNPTQYNTTQYNPNPTQHNTMQSNPNSTQHNPTPTQHNTTQCNPTQCNPTPTQHNTMQNKKYLLGIYLRDQRKSSWIPNENGSVIRSTPHMSLIRSYCKRRNFSGDYPDNLFNKGTSLTNKKIVVDTD